MKMLHQRIKTILSKQRFKVSVFAVSEVFLTKFNTSMYILLQAHKR